MNALTVFSVGYFTLSVSGLLLCSEQLYAGIYFGLDGNSASENGDWLKELRHVNLFEGASLERQSVVDCNISICARDGDCLWHFRDFEC
jgi:hypothetical protein